jgi:hypothetical protein
MRSGVLPALWCATPLSTQPGVSCPVAVKVCCALQQC